MTASSLRPPRLFLAAICLAPWLATAAAADTTSWKLDPTKSRLGFSGTQTGTKFEGSFTRYSAAIVFDPDHLDSSHITVSVDLASAATGDTQRDTALPGTDWFDIADFPQAKFDTTTIQSRGAGAYEAAGVLTLRGVSHPLVLPFTLEITGAVAHASGHVQLARTAFGVGQGPWATGQWVALDVGVDIDIIAARDP